MTYGLNINYYRQHLQELRSQIDGIVKVNDFITDNKA